MRRRHLLQFTGSTIAALTAESMFPAFAKQQSQALSSLSKSGTRKLALLVGINRYSGEGLRSLRGCLMDIDMQRELLLSRFGFNPADILMLTDDTPLKPTRNNIINAYEQHLIAQAKPDDVVVFHFSGHGSQVADPDPIESDGTLGTLVPIDRPSATNSDLDITGRTLFLLTQSLKTENVTTILDACHSGGTFRSHANATVRSIVSSAQSLTSSSAQSLTSSSTRLPAMSDAEVTYQTQRLKTIALSQKEFSILRHQGIAKGIALGSAYRNQYSADSNFGDFYAGAFSYLLTRSLWQAARNESIGNLFVDLARRTEDLADATQIVQTPVFDLKPGSQLDRAPAYLTESVSTGAEGVVKSIQGNRLELWLGGIPAHSLDAFEKGAVFNILNLENQPIAQVKQTGRSGLTATGQVLQGSNMRSGQLVPGQLIQEQVRGIPVDLTLTIGVQNGIQNGVQSSSAQNSTQNSVQNNKDDPTIKRIESEFTNYPRFKFVRLNQEDNVAVDAVLQSQDVLIWQLKTGADRLLKEGDLSTLRASLQSLLAAKVLRSLANGESARLAVTTEIRHADRQTLITTTRSRSDTTRSAAHTKTPLPTLPLKPGDAIEIQIQNNSDLPLYAAAIAIDSSANLILLYPQTPKPTPIAPRTTLTVPDRTNGPTYRLTLQPPAGSLELLTFTSTEPLGDILRGLKQLTPTRNGPRSPAQSPMMPSGTEALAIVGYLLGTLDRSPKSQHSTHQDTQSQGTAVIDNSQFALLSTLIQVTD